MAENKVNKKIRQRQSKPNVGDGSKEILCQINENNPVYQMFLDYSKQLDDRHDRYERIVKLSRDITIESKRIIFSLHSSGIDVENKREQILKDVDTRLKQLVNKQFKSIALELEGLDSYQYLRAYTSGIQEFIEALSFHHYIINDNIKQWDEVKNIFDYEIEEGNENEGNAKKRRRVELLFPEIEFVLGIADFTGELMRKCINSLGSGNIDECFKITNFVKDVLIGFLSVHAQGHRNVHRKLYVLKQSLAKMELVCYNIKVRGSEKPKDMLIEIIDSAENLNDIDEGFY